MKEVVLTNGGIAFVDNEDYSVISRHTWHKELNGNVWYAWCNIGLNKKVTMHRLVFGARLARVIDHVNRNGLDNRKINLRFVTISHNTVNGRKSKNPCTSIYKGVWHGYDGKWYANINCNLKRYSLGKFDTEADAATAYNKKALELFGCHAYLNNLPDAGKGERK